ncbi:MAG: ribosome hibernation-promoting factor, HPF/YfiA family [Chakrabartia sp.]
MDIRVSGHQVDTGGALQSQVSDRLQAIATKYFSRAHSAHATFSKGPHDHGFVCDIIMHVVRGVVLKASASAQEARFALDGAADKIEKQLRRYKRRLRDDHSGPNNVALPEENAAYTVFEQTPDDVPDAEDNPIIIAETRVDVPEASVSDAVMMLDLRHTNALLFRNAGTGVFNMVYRRNDGTIGWVEPQAKS